jgi:hypothetical protein
MTLGHVLWICWVAFCACYAFAKFKGGIIRIANFGAPIQIIERRTQSVKYWSFVTFFYAILAGLAVLPILIR